MKKVFTLLLVLIMGVAIVACSNSNPESTPGIEGGTDDTGEKQFELVGGINLPTTHPYYLGLVRFGELMEEYSGGSITLEVFPSAQLGNERDVVEALQLGSVDVTLISAAPLSNFTDDFQLFDFPYIFNSREHAYEVLDGEIGRTMLDNLVNYDLIGLSFMENGFYWIGSTKPINSPEDVKGLKIRSLENEMQVHGYGQWGANGIAMAFSEVPTSLQNGTLDAVGLTTAVMGVTGIYKNVNAIAKTWHYYAAAPLLMSKVTFDSMSPSQQEAVRKAAKEATDYQRQESLNCDTEYENIMKNEGITLTFPDLGPFYDAMVPGTYEDYVGEGKLIDADLYAKVKEIGENYGGDPGTWRP
jgi:tripartite ATP-independent transporter DctP family solute receptor